MKDNKNNKPRGMIKLSSVIKILLLIVVAAIIILGSLVTSIVLGIFKKAPVIDHQNTDHNSLKLLGSIQATES